MRKNTKTSLIVSVTLSESEGSHKTNPYFRNYCGARK
jgi:hypothetical protein